MEKKKLKTEPRLTVQGGVYGEDKVKFISLSDVFVFPSKIDTFPLVVIEALCASKMVIAYNVGANKDIIGNGGIVVDPAIDGGLEKAICFVCDNPEVVTEYSTHARERYEKFYQYDIFSENLIKIINEIFEVVSYD